MSRKIAEKSAVTIAEEETDSRKTDEGKLIFTRYRRKSGVFLLKKDKLTVAAFPAESRVGEIYLARVANVAKNIDACFVEIQPGEICFLPLKDAQFPFLLNRSFDGRILEGDELVVQITRDAQKTKQPSVTAHISLSNDYFALVFGPTRAGFSAKLAADEKKLLEKKLKEADVTVGGCLVQPSGDNISQALPGLPSLGLIVRTRAAELAESDATLIKEHFQRFLEEFLSFFRNAVHRTCFSCLKKNSLIDNIMSEFLTNLAAPEEFSELLTDDPLIYAQLEEYRNAHLTEKSLRLYEDALLSLSKLYSLESRVEEALTERVWLKSGGYLMIQPTEALTVIDVNSGKYEGRKDDFLRVNLEAAQETARQIRLRNLSGIIIVDFINMKEAESRAEVMDCLKKHVHRDRVKTTVVDMTPLGLVEITRKKITKPLRETLSGGNLS
ncbi:MAG: ribonuclease E/G [Butyrivibrio sp.]|nr:ribonuclease E/G [Acetatifactor muris]MCM1557982.1 ribonuclease E/G [Butyrivibrio sp.]